MTDTTTAGRGNVVCFEAYLGVPPKPEFHEAVAKCQEQLHGIVKDEPMKKRGRFSKTEDWIRECKGVILAAGLVAQQLGGLHRELPSTVSPGKTKGVQLVAFSLVHRASGTGMVYYLDWPLYGEKRDDSPAFITRGAFTSTFKYFLRGAFMVDQVELAEEPEAQKEGYTDSRGRHDEETERRKEEARAKAKAANLERAKKLREQQGRVEDDERVKQAQEELGAELDDEKGKPNTNPHKRAEPEDGKHDPTMKELLEKGWNPEFAKHLAAHPANEPISDGLKVELKNAINEFFSGDRMAAGPLWENTGFTPQGKKGPQPTGAHVRRFCVQMNWKERREAAAAAGSN